MHANKFSFSTERHFVLHWKLWNGSDLDETAIINDIWQENESDMCLASKRRSESWVFFCSHLQNYNIIICNTAYVSEHSLWISVSLSNLKEKKPQTFGLFSCIREFFVNYSYNISFQSLRDLKLYEMGTFKMQPNRDGSE